MFVGVDIGTQSLKAIVTDSGLSPLSEVTQCYRAEFPRPGWAEQSPALWEDALGPVISQALAQAGVSADRVAALGVCGQLDGCIAVGANGDAIGNCIVWMDRRAEESLAGVSVDDVHRRSGVVADASHLAAKARWLKRSGGAANKPVRFHGPVSYVVERLTGRSVMDHAVASTTMVYDLETRGWSSELLSAFELDATELPAIDEAGACAERLSARGARLTGLPQGIPVAVGTGDDFSTPLGAGIVEPGRIAVVLGTGEVVGGLIETAVLDGNRLVETHGYPSGGFMLENPGWLCGGALAWAMELLHVESAAAFDLLAAKASPGADDVLFVPALTGAMSPKWIASARGCFYGLTPAHGPQHLARAVMEGCAFAMRDVVDRLIALGVEAKELSLLAGGSRSTLWAQIRADISGLPVTTPAHVQTSAIAAAMLAGAAAGEFTSLRQAAALATPPRSRLQPNPETQAVMSRAYERYRRLCESLDPIFREPVAPHS